MTCDCNKPQGKFKNVCGANTPPVLEVHSEECPVLFHTVVIPASVGDPTTMPPEPGMYRNVRLTYEATGDSYLFDSDGIPQYLANKGIVDSVNGKIGVVVLDAEDIGAASGADINDLQSQIDALAAASDVTDIVGTYADLMAYDTSKLKDNDIIKVLQDETHDGETTYYRWIAASSTFSLIGEEGPYYTKSAADTKFQDKLTAGANITIDANNEISATDTTYTAGANITIDANNEISATNTTYTAGTNVSIDSDNVISATDTTYSDFVGTDGVDSGSNGLVPAPATTDASKFLKADGTWAVTPDTTYTNFTGTDGVDPGVAGLVPAPTTSDTDKYLKSDGTWATVSGGGGGGTLYSSTGQNTDGAMTQKAVTDTLFDNNKLSRVKIGQYATSGADSTVAIGSSANANSSGAISIGSGSQANYNQNAIAIGMNAKVTTSSHTASVALGAYSNCAYAYSVSLGSYSSPRAQGVVDVKALNGSTKYGYQGTGDAARTEYRVISGVHPGEDDHDVATIGQTLQVQYLSQQPTNTTAGKLGSWAIWNEVVDQYTTLAHLYFCVRIVNYDPDHPDYIWQQLF